MNRQSNLALTPVTQRLYGGSLWGHAYSVVLCMSNRRYSPIRNNG